MPLDDHTAVPVGKPEENFTRRNSSLAGREIVLAGGSGGIGSEAARWLAHDRARLFVSYCSNKERAEQLKEEVSLIPESYIDIIRADIRKDEERAQLLGSARQLYGLVVLAGIPARNLTEWDDSLGINYSGAIKLAREAAEKMRRSNTNGSIVLMATVQAVPGFPTANTTYAGAKAALLHAGRILAKEYRGRDQVRVNVISPGIIDAGMGAASVKSGKYLPYLNDNCIGRYGSARDVALAIRFFLEPDNYITGQNLLVDGGLGLGLGV